MFTSSTTINPLTGACKQDEAVLADEEPLEIRLGYQSKQGQRVHRNLTVLMRSPGQDIELCFGYLLSRNIIQAAAQVLDIETYKTNRIRIELVNDCLPDFKKSGLDTALKTLPDPAVENTPRDSFLVRAQYLAELARNLGRKLDLFHSTGSTTACGLFDEFGVVLQVAEDIRIQNAVDKLLGQLLLKGKLPLRKHGLIVSTGPDFELLQRALRVNCPMLASLAAPSSLAVEQARQADMSLLAFLQDGAFSIYHDPERVMA